MNKIWSRAARRETQPDSFEPPTPGTVRKLERNEKRKKLENCSMTCAAGNDGCFNKIEDSQHHRIPDISLKNGIWRFFGVKTHPQGIGHVVFVGVWPGGFFVQAFCQRLLAKVPTFDQLFGCWMGMTWDDRMTPLFINQWESQTVQRFDFTMTKRPTTCLKVSRRCAQEEGRSSEREGANWQRVQGTEPRSPWSSRWGTLMKRHRVACISYTCSSWLGIIWYHQYHPVLSILSGWWFGQFFIFPYIGNNHPNWLSYFSEGLKPPTSYRLTRQLQYAASPSSVYFSNRGKKMSQTWIMDDYGLSKSWLADVSRYVEKRNLQILAPTS